MAAIDKVIQASIDGVKRSGALESGALMGVVSAVDTGGTLTVARGTDVYPAVRILSGYNHPVVGDTVEILRTAGGWVCIGALRSSSAPRIQSGRATTPVPSGGFSDIAVTFSGAFPAAPRIVITPDTTAPQNMTWGVMNVANTGFTIRCYRTTANATNFMWLATDH